MLYREKTRQSHSYRRIPTKHNSDRLVFPGRENEEGYIGKKQFGQKHHDQVILRSPGSQKVIRYDKLNTEGMQGAHPSLNIESVRNIEKMRSRVASGDHLVRAKTDDTSDSLDILLKGCGQRSYRIKTESAQKVYPPEREQDLWLSKQRVLGIQNVGRGRKQAGELGRKVYVNPTYLSSFRPSGW